MSQMTNLSKSWVFLFLLLASASFANAQSTDRDNPTPIPSNKASAFFDGSNTNDGFYYSYVANPGELKITFTLEAGKRSVNQIELDVFNEDARKLATKNLSSGSGRTEQAILRVNIEKRQTILLRITIYHANGEGQFRLQLDSGVARNEGTASPKIFYFPDAAPTKVVWGINFDNLPTAGLPNKGILKILMKDGSIIVIDLSAVSASTVDTHTRK